MGVTVIKKRGKWVWSIINDHDRKNDLAEDEESDDEDLGLGPEQKFVPNFPYYDNIFTKIFHLLGTGNDSAQKMTFLCTKGKLPIKTTFLPRK